MTTWQLLVFAWIWPPAVLAGLAALLAAYLFAVRFRLPASAAYFAAGLVFLALALVSPIATLSGALLSAHMIQYLFLAMVAPPLLLTGIPSEAVEWALKRRWLASMEEVLRKPVVAWISGVGVMAAWHIPFLHMAAMRSHALHMLQSASFVVSGTIFWWLVFSPLEQRRLAPIAAVVYLSTACIFCSVTGIVITFGPPGIYPMHAAESISPAMLSLVRNDWGLTAETDQRLGGLLMWVPGCFGYLSGMLVTLGRWYTTPDRKLASPEALSGGLLR